MKRILILGGSGCLGNVIYKELHSYFDTYATYRSNKQFRDNQHFYRFDFELDNIEVLLKKLKPSFIISALRGNFDGQILLHQQLVSYVKNKKCRIIFLSSANVFDGFSHYPSYEYDKTLSESIYGRLKIKIENMLMRLPEDQHVILRLPMVFGSGSNRLKELKEYIENGEAYEVFPDLIMNVTSVDFLARQVHYIINRRRRGIFHLGSRELIHHDQFISELCETMGYYNVLFKKVYTLTFDRYLAVLPKDNLLPKHLQVSYHKVIENSNLI